VTHIHATSDPSRPATNRDLRLLNEALIHLPVSVWHDHVDAEYGGRGLRELTHGECEELRAWALREWVR
jgi:hypothetical protein